MNALLIAAPLVLWALAASRRDEDDPAAAMLEQAREDAEGLRELPTLRELAEQGSQVDPSPAPTPTRQPRRPVRRAKPAPRPAPRPASPARRKPGRKPARKPAPKPARKPEPAELTDAQKAREAAEAAARAAARAERQETAQPEPRPKPARPSRPEPTQREAPRVTARSPTLPAGYDPARARAQAQKVANHLLNAGGGRGSYEPSQARSKYARRLVANWQRWAGLEPDGIYGPRTHNALKHYGATRVVPPLFTKQRDGSHLRASDPRAAYVPPEER